MKLKRILAAALCLIVMAAILPAAAFAAGTRRFTIAFQTADISGAGTDADVWAVIWYDDYGLDTYKSPLLDNPGNDFERNHKDFYTFDIPDKPIHYVEVVYEDAGWVLEYVEFDGYRYGYRTDGKKMVDVELDGDDSFKIDANDPKAKPADERVFTMALKTAADQYAGTDADVWAVIQFEDGKTFKRELDNSGNDFEMGQKDYYTFDIPNKPIRSVKIEYEDAGDWKLDYVEIDGDKYFRPADEWLYDDDDFTIYITEGGYWPEDITVLTFHTGDWSEGGTESKLKLTFCYKDPDTGEITESVHTAPTWHDGHTSRFKANNTDEVIVRNLPTGKELVYIKVTCDAPWNENEWDLDWMRINQGENIPCHYTYRENNRDFVVFPGVELVDKTLNVYVGEDGTSDVVYAKFGFEDGTETGFYRLPEGLEEYKYYSFVLTVPDKSVRSVTIKSTTDGDYDNWYLGYMNFDGSHFSAYCPITYKDRNTTVEETFYYDGYESSNAGSVFGDANMGIIICVGAAVIVIAAAAVIVGVRKKKKTQEEM